MGFKIVAKSLQWGVFVRLQTIAKVMVLVSEGDDGITDGGEMHVVVGQDMVKSIIQVKAFVC